MNSIDTVSWAGSTKADAVKFSEIDSSEWVGKAEAAMLLGVHVRQLERRASLGQIAKRVLPKKPTEKAARVVYSRADIEAVRSKPPEADMDESELALLPMTKDEVYRHLSISSTLMASLIQRGKLTPQRAADGSETFARAEVEIVKTRLEWLRQHRGQGSARKAVAGRLKIADIEMLAAALARAFPPPAEKPRLKRWLTLKEAAVYTGLPARWLAEAARAGKMRAQNVGVKRDRWMFPREGLR